MKKIIGIFIVTLLIGTTSLPLVSSTMINNNQILNKTFVDDCGCDSNRRYGMELSKKSSNNDPPAPWITGVPDYFSWKDFGGQDWTTPAKDQNYPNWCGSCWAFAALGSLESVINIREGSAVIDPDLSEQYPLSCLPSAHVNPGHGCLGGCNYLALKYMMETTPEGNYHNGALFEECFPYQADDQVPCDSKCADWVDKLVPIEDTFEWYLGFSSENISFIKSLIMEKGSLSCGMFTTAGFESWMSSHHDSDDYYPYYEKHGFNHCLVVVGWKDDSSIEKGGYWICKNSFGQDIGYDGFFNIEYGSHNICGAVCFVDYDPESYEWPNEPNPPDAPDINGPTSGHIEQAVDYVFKAIDPNDKDVKFFISWGDGTTEWTSFTASDTPITVGHTWAKQGTYSIMALAMNTDNSISSWNNQDVTMPKSKVINRPILNFLERHPYLFPILRQLLLKL